MLVRSVVLLLWLPALTWACEAPLRVFVNDWPPYVNVSRDGDALNVDGLDVNVLKALAREAGCTLAWVELPVDRAHAALRTGQVDLLMAASRIPSRESYAWFSRPYRRETIAVVGTLGTPEVRGWPEITGRALTVAVPRRGWYGKDYEQHRQALLQQGQLSFMGDYRGGVAMLKAGRVDLVMGDTHALEAAAREVELVLSRPMMTLSDGPVHLMFSRATVSRDLVRRVDAILSRWQQDHTLERLRWGYLP